MEIKRAGSKPSGKGPEGWFTGTVRIDPLFQPKDPSRVASAAVTFEPGARTAWHTFFLVTLADHFLLVDFSVVLPSAFFFEAERFFIVGITV